MQNRSKTASILMTIVAVLHILFAISLAYYSVVLLELAPQMETIIGRTTAELVAIDPKLLEFILVPLRVVPSTILAMGVAGILLARGLRDGNRQARTALFAMMGTWLPLAMIISLTEFPTSPWPLWSLCCILTAVAFFLSREDPATGARSGTLEGR